MSLPALPSDPVLRTEGLTHTVGGRVLVDGVSVEVARGDVLAVVGPSGAGKSSLLRLLNRLDEPTAGTVYLDGVDYRTLPPRTLRQRVGMVMQAPYLFPGTVAENIGFGPEQHGKHLAREDLARLLERVGLGGFEDRDVARLSGGEAQRVSVARTLANRPEVLLLDEPTSALDEEAKADVEELLADVVRDRALTAVLVTHDPGQAARLADRVLTLEAGRVVGIQPATEASHA
ncbi:MAG: ATP-binding cassette domain-containing protein [Rhodothermales bacterium]